METSFESNFISKIKDNINNIDEKITSPVYNLFHDLLNDTTENSYDLKNSKNFNLFSWMNCSALGQDYNATLSILKSNLSKELKLITYLSLSCEFLLIANLYIMVGLSKNLKDKKFETNEAKNTSKNENNSIEEIEFENTDDIYQAKTKNNSGEIDKRKGKGRNEKKDFKKNPTLESISSTERKTFSQNGEKMVQELKLKNNNKNVDNDQNDKNNGKNMSYNNRRNIITVKKLID